MTTSMGSLAPMGGPRLLNVFLCHSSHDKPRVRELYGVLRSAGCKPWLDEEDIPGGTDWNDAIEDAVKAAHVVVVCVSQHSVTAEGYLQRELRFALAVADEKPDGTIFILPLRLEDCEVPRKLQHLERVDYFRDNGLACLLKSLRIRAQQVEAIIPSDPAVAPAHLPALLTAYERVGEAAAFVLSRCASRPALGVVLGAGMSGFCDRLSAAWSLDYDQIPHFPLPPGRVSLGRLVIGLLDDIPIVVMLGRPHAYEGLRLDEVTFPTRMLARMGIRALIFTAAVGGLNPSLAPGSLVMLSDHINQLGVDPLAGPDDPRVGPRFPDMSEVYSVPLRSLAHEAASRLGLTLSQTVFLGRTGPSYQTPAEARAMRSLGADVEGMSTVAEAMVARQMGLPVLALAVVTSVVTMPPLAFTEVEAAARRSAQEMEALLAAVIPAVVGQAGSES